MKTKVLSFILAFLMVFSAIVTPVAIVHAEDFDSEIPLAYVITDGDVNYYIDFSTLYDSYLVYYLFGPDFDGAD